MQVIIVGTTMASTHTEMHIKHVLNRCAHMHAFYTRHIQMHMMVVRERERERESERAMDEGNVCFILKHINRWCALNMNTMFMKPVMNKLSYPKPSLSLD